MADDALVITGGGIIAAASDELFLHADMHARLGMIVAEAQAALAQVDQIADSTGAAQRAIDMADIHLGEARRIAEGLPIVLHAAATAYGVADRVRDGLWDALFEAGSWVAGLLLRTMTPAVVGLSALGAGVSFVGLLAASGGRPGEWMEKHPELYTNGFFTGLVGNVAEHSDATVTGFAGALPWLTPLVGGTPGVARLLAASHPFGMFRETPVRIDRTIPLLPPQPPDTLLGAAERIKSMEASGAQVIVEQYELPDGSSVANVYIDGTIDWSPWPGEQPWDMAANVGGVAQNAHVGSAEAVKLAMRDAGIDAQTPVQLFGYSQGGIQAALVTHQQEFNVVSLVTIGSPVGDIEIPDSVRALSIGHDEDPVFAFGDDQINQQTLQVTTERFAHEPMPHIAAPGHQFQPYVQTLDRVDDSRAPQLEGRLEHVIGMTREAISSSSTAYRLERYTPEACAPVR